MSVIILQENKLVLRLSLVETELSTKKPQKKPNSVSTVSGSLCD